MKKTKSKDSVIGEQVIQSHLKVHEAKEVHSDIGIPPAPYVD